MKVLFSAIKYDYNDPSRGYSFEYENFYKALSRMKNIELIFFDTCDFWDEERRKKINRELIETVEREKPDILFNFFYRDQITKETYLYIKNNTKTVLVNWFADDHWRFNGSDNPSSEWCWCFDYCVTTDVDAIEKYYSIGYHNVFLSQWACNHYDYVKMDFPVKTYKYDVSFVGQPHSNRREIIEFLASRGITVHCFGYGWDQGNPARTRVAQEDMVRIFNQSKINLNLSNSSAAGAKEQIKGRNFEVPGCGGFLLTSETYKLEDYYALGKEVVCYKTPQEIADKIVYFLEHEQERENIRIAGYERTLREHTYEKRFSDIFEHVTKSAKIVKGMEFNADILLYSLEKNKASAVIEKSEQIVSIISARAESLPDPSFCEELQKKYQLRMVDGNDWNALTESVEQSDICFFSEVSDALILASRMPKMQDKKLICRIMNEELNSDKLHKVNWNAVNVVQCNSEKYKYFLRDRLQISERKIAVVPIGINERAFSYRARRKGYSVAYFGDVTAEKGSMLLLQFVKKLAMVNPKYKVYVAGTFYDMRDVLYYKQMIVELGIQNNLVVEAIQGDLGTWLEDKEYFLCTSQYQEHSDVILKAMAKGIKPLLHNYIGAEDEFPEKYRWTTINEAIAMVRDKEFNSSEYRDFVKHRRNSRDEGRRLAQLIYIMDHVNECEKNTPLVTIGITNYNYGNFIEQCMESAATQSYKNVEILVVDDLSKDDSVEKIKRYEKKYPTIRGIYNEKNSGCGVLTIRQVIESAQGEFFKIIDADDFYGNDTIIEQYVNSFVLNPEVDYIYANRQVVDAEGQLKEVWEYKEWADEDIISTIFARFSSGIIPMYGMFRTSFYRKHDANWTYVPDVKVAYDTLHCIMNVARKFKRKYLNKTLLNYRQHGNNITQGVATRIRSHAIVLEYVISNFDEAQYLPNYSWAQMNATDRKAFKNFVLGNYYMEFYRLYYSGKWKPWDFESNIETATMVEYLAPVAELIEKYFAACRVQTSAYDAEIEKVCAELKQLQAVAGGQMTLPQKQRTKVFIGMPVYNGECYIKEALESLRKQSHTEWKLLISDNGSTDGTEAICRIYCEMDPRISYIRQPVNVGAANNFKYVLDQCDCEFFMWAAHDDVWREKFIESALVQLNDPKVGMAFSEIVNTDSYGRIIREYDSFTKYVSTDQSEGVKRYLDDPEIMGKANLIYSVFRTEVCKAAYAVMPLVDQVWGIDMCFVLAMLTRTKLAVTPEVLLEKRIVRAADKKEHVDRIVINEPERHVFPAPVACDYILNLTKAAKDTSFYQMTVETMLERFDRLIKTCMSNGD